MFWRTKSGTLSRSLNTLSQQKVHWTTTASSPPLPCPPAAAASLMGSSTATALLTELQSSTNFTTNTYKNFSNYLHEFTTLSKPKSTDVTTIRSLAKQFLSFLNTSLSLLPKRLSESPKLPDESAPHLFDIYRLCLNCLEIISSQLSCKPYAVQAQRVRYIHCLDSWGKYQEVECEGLTVLKVLRENAIGKIKKEVKKSRSTQLLLPQLDGEYVDQEFALLVVEIVVTLVKCASLIQNKAVHEYDGLLDLVKEVVPWLKWVFFLFHLLNYISCWVISWNIWTQELDNLDLVIVLAMLEKMFDWLNFTNFGWFRVLDMNARKKLHPVLVTYLNRITLIMVGDFTKFNGDLVCKFCIETLCQIKQSPLKDQLFKVKLSYFSFTYSRDVFSVYSNRYMCTVCKEDMLFSVLTRTWWVL